MRQTLHYVNAKDVSIPHRKAINKAEWVHRFSTLRFQFLIGKLSTASARLYPLKRKSFNSS